MPTFSLSSPGTDWASLHGIQAVPFAPGPGGAKPNPEWGHEPVTGTGGGIPWSPGPNPSWGHEPFMSPSNMADASNNAGQDSPSAQFLLSALMNGHATFQPSVPNTNFTGQGNNQPFIADQGNAYSQQPNTNFTGHGAGPNPDWGKLFRMAPLWSNGDQSGSSNGGGLDHNSLAAMINQLLGGNNKLFGGSGGAWGNSGGGAWGGG